MTRKTTQFILALILIFALPLFPKPAAADSVQLNIQLNRLEPAQGAYFGVGLDWEQDSLNGYAGRLGYMPAVAVRFFGFPFTESDLVQLEIFMSQVAAAESRALITLEPYTGLDTITPSVALDLAIRLEAFNAAGVPVFVRFAHEMNGSWYPWSQQPALYREKHRLLAEAIYARAPQTAML